MASEMLAAADGWVGVAAAGLAAAVGGFHSAAVALSAVGLEGRTGANRTSSWSDRAMLTDVTTYAQQTAVNLHVVELHRDLLLIRSRCYDTLRICCVGTGTCELGRSTCLDVLIWVANEADADRQWRKHMRWICSL